MENAKEAIKLLKALVDDTVVQIEKLRVSTNITEVCKFYRDLHEVSSLIETYLDIMKSTRTEFSERILPDLFENLGVDSIKAHNRNFVLNSRAYFSIPKDKQQEGHKWLKEKGYEMLIKEDVNAQTLSAAMNEYVEIKGEYPPEEVMSKYIKKYISLKKA